MKQKRTVKSYAEENCPDGYLTAQDYAKKSGYSYGAVVYAIHEGRLEHVRIGHYFYVKEDAVVQHKPRKDGGARRACNSEPAKWTEEYKYTTEDIAKANGISKPRVAQLRASGRLDAVKIGGRYLHKTTEVGAPMRLYFVPRKTYIPAYVTRAAVFAYIEGKGLTEDMLQWVLARVRGKVLDDGKTS